MIDDNLAKPNPKAPYMNMAAAHAVHGIIVPKDMLIIGCSDDDDPLMLSIRGSRKGRVFVKRMDFIEPADYEELATRPEEHVYEVAESFAKFMDLLDYGEDEEPAIAQDSNAGTSDVGYSPGNALNTSEPNLDRDAAALFRHMQNAGMDADQYMRWSFMFAADEIERLEDLGQFLDSRLREFFHVLLQESTEEIGADGSEMQGPPLLRLESVGVADEAMLAGFHERLEALADKYGVRYLGSSNFSEFPFDLDMFDAVIDDKG